MPKCQNAKTPKRQNAKTPKRQKYMQYYIFYLFVKYIVVTGVHKNNESHE
jgi:hypothetical protein